MGGSRLHCRFNLEPWSVVRAWSVDPWWGALGALGTGHDGGPGIRYLIENGRRCSCRPPPSRAVTPPGPIPPPHQCPVLRAQLPALQQRSIIVALYHCTRHGQTSTLHKYLCTYTMDGSESGCGEDPDPWTPEPAGPGKNSAERRTGRDLELRSRRSSPAPGARLCLCLPASMGTTPSTLHHIPSS